MKRFAWFVVWFSAALAAVAAETQPSGLADVVRLADGRLQIGLDPRNGTIRELVERPQGDNQLAGRPEPFALWQILLGNGETTKRLSADQAGTPHVEHLAGDHPGLRLVWDKVATGGKESLRVEVGVRLGEQNGTLSRWDLSIAKPRDLRLKHVCFPRLPALRPRADDVLALPLGLGAMMNGPRKALAGRDGKGTRLSWVYPGAMSAQCLAYYQPDGLGFYAACDDPLAYTKTFTMWADPQKQVHFEVIHRPEQEAVGSREYRLPYAVVLGTFHGDWSTAAQIYRESHAARVWAERGRLWRGQVPDWVRETGIWVWNRGRSQDVLPPAAALADHAQVPVSVFWHWWHDCAYDAGFPDYLPPREGEASFAAALDAAHQHGLHVLPYMNQRLWGTTAPSWTAEGAEAWAVKGPDGKVHPEHYNTFINAPCAVMCMGTDFWRSKYAGMACEVISRLKADGIYMDQACCTPAPCFDPRHGHILGPGRDWADGFGLLSLTIRDRCAGANSPLKKGTGSEGVGMAVQLPPQPFPSGELFQQAAKPVLAGEHCGEPWLPYLDLMLTLTVSDERTAGGAGPWSVIPFFPAVYHTSVICYGSYGSLVYPPYDERWPAEKAPPERLTLLDRKFSGQFCLEQARSFVWGVQPMIPNFLPSQLQERREEIDYATRLARTRVKALKYLVHGTWLRPPKIDVPQRELDIAKLGTYTKLTASKKRVPVVLAGAWRAADSDIGIALASIHDEQLRLRLPIDVAAYGLARRCDVYRIDDAGRHPAGQFDPRKAILEIDLPPRAGCVLELCHDDDQQEADRPGHAAGGRTVGRGLSDGLLRPVRDAGRVGRYGPSRRRASVGGGADDLPFARPRTEAIAID